MEIVCGRAYRVVVRYPWGERVETTCERVERDAAGTIRWPSGGAEDAYLEGVIREAPGWVLGWYGGHCDVTVLISEDPDAPEP